jgi:hypothetical protein
MAKFTIQGSNNGRDGDYVDVHGSWTFGRRTIIEASCFWDALIRAQFSANIVFLANSPQNSMTKREYKTLWNSYTFIVEKVE